MAITIASSQAETIDGLEAYLLGAGVRTKSVSQLERIDSALSGASALFLFADDFPERQSLAAFARIRTASPDLLLVVVTERAAPFHALVQAPTDRVLVLPRPAWGWMLLDALRAGLAGRRRG